MSFSSKVKEELSKDCNNPRHCCIAETAAIISMCGKVIFDEKDRVRIEIHTENVTVARKYFTLLEKSSSITPNGFISLHVIRIFLAVSSSLTDKI